MSNFSYKARDADGKLVKGEMEALNRDELIDKLHKMGLMTTQIKESDPAMNIDLLLDKFVRISINEMVMFYVQLANMLSSGISLLSCLESLSNQIENKRLKDVVSRVQRNIESGDSFSQALGRQPGVFPMMFVNMVRAGESSGKLDLILRRYAEFAERQEDLRQKVQAALFYPLILLVAGLGVTLFIVIMVIPQFFEIFTKSGISVPLPTLILYRTGMAFKHFWFFIILFLIGAWKGTGYYVSTAHGRLVSDSWKLHCPILGGLFRKVALTRFTRTFGILLDSGVAVLPSLDIAQDVVGNEVLARAIALARQRVESGEKIFEALKISKEFPLDVIQMISAGEESGNLGSMLSKVADFYERMLEYGLKKVMTIIEPLLLLLIGGLVGFIMISMLLPIFDMMKMLRH